MRLVYVVHILAGSLVLLSGYVALYATKGATVHRKSGMLFVVAMLTMCSAATVLAAVRWSWWSVINLSAAMLTAYLVITAFVTVRVPAGWTSRLDVGLTVLALGIGLTMLTLAVQAIINGGKWNGIPAFPLIPKPIRIPGLLALPVLAVLVTLVYWMWRVRIRRSLRGIVGVAAPKTVRPA